ncbi:MAG: hypothetical protein HC897_07875 [Thermoanaerobaculia bacterium]|nr:hypothetical protein [Thermoanaerobaculia bacterium]
MKLMAKTKNLISILGICLCSVAGAQTSDFTPKDGETLKEFTDRLESTGKAKAKANATEKSLNQKLEKIATQPSTPTATGGFGSRIEGSLTDFLPLFDFAIDAIDTADDQKSVTVSFSPVKVGPFGEIDFTAKISEPQPFESLLNEIPEAARAAQKEAISKDLGDYSDILWSATYGLQWKVHTHWSDTPRLLFGRNPNLYESLIHELMSEVMAETVWPLMSEEVGRILGRCEAEIGERTGEGDLDNLEATKVRALLEGNSVCSWEDYKQALAERQNQLAAVNAKLEDQQIDQLTAMIDNQPQLTLTASMRDFDDLAGQDETSAMLKFEIGTRNFNTVLREYRRMTKRKASGVPNAPAPSTMAALEVVGKRPYEKKDKLTLALVWRQRDDYSITYEFTEKATDPASGEEVEFPRSVSLDLEKRNEWCGMAMWSRSLPSQSFKRGDQKIVPRLEGAIEYVDVQGDPKRQNRLVARVSYLLPGPEGMTLPFTVTWADKSEFLGEQDQVFGAHLGISYKIKSGSGKIP